MLEKIQKRFSHWEDTSSGYGDCLLLWKTFPVKLAIELKDVIQFNNLIETCYDFPFGKYISAQDCAHYSFRRNDYTVVAAPPTKTHKCKQNYFYSSL